MFLDRGICDLCGQPVWLNERTVYLKNDNIAHYECYEEIVIEQDKKEEQK